MNYWTVCLVWEDGASSLPVINRVIADTPAEAIQRAMKENLDNWGLPESDSKEFIVAGVFDGHLWSKA